ncbi:SH3 domain-containing protein [uncultured Thiodictyon sp.]|uniref:SH3 domain-containing protein n=1 Tax=uncultured Thiodictyon sp. TaxID=1846217 RepID=UPI0025ED2394|nr:SH3 domain-containing protein [uncultured Thiodictyon sp.]
MRPLTLWLCLALALPALAADGIRSHRQPQGHNPDFADALAGGPDFWEVTGLAGGDTLNLRAGPSAHARVVGEIRNGSVLRNLGCRMSGKQRWCHVARPQDSTANGWVAGRYLRESSYQP